MTPNQRLERFHAAAMKAVLEYRDEVVQGANANAPIDPAVEVALKQYGETKLDGATPVEMKDAEEAFIAQMKAAAPQAFGLPNNLTMALFVYEGEFNAEMKRAVYETLKDRVVEPKPVRPVKATIEKKPQSYTDAELNKVHKECMGFLAKKYPHIKTPLHTEVHQSLLQLIAASIDAIRSEDTPVRSMRISQEKEKPAYDNAKQVAANHAADLGINEWDAKSYVVNYRRALSSSPTFIKVCERGKNIGGFGVA